VSDVRDALRAAQARDLDTEGIPMLLALQGAAPAPLGDPRRRAGAALADRLARVHAAVRATPEGAAATPDRCAADAVAVLADAWVRDQPLGVGDGAPAEPAGARFPVPGLDAALREGRWVTAVNYHETPRSQAARTRRELAALAGRFAPTGVAELQALFAGERWRGSRLPLLPVFYEGFSSHVAVAAPACRAAGLVGWFFVVTGFLDAAPGEQIAFAQAHDLGLAAESEVPGAPAPAMSWAQARALAGEHVVTAHTAHHRPARSLDGSADAAAEIVAPRRRVRELTGVEGPAHAWLNATALALAPEHAGALRDSGCRWVFSELAIEQVA
jgi:hypothetical protein